MIVVVAACGGGNPTAVGSPIGTAPVPEPSTTAVPLESPSPPSAPLSRVDFSCRLPAYSESGADVSSFFVSFPDFAVTPAAQNGYSYDRSVDRWLPVDSRAVSPDGLRYAYAEGWSATPAKAPNVHIVDAASGTDVRVVTMPDALPYSVVAYTADGVLLMIRYEATVPGIWRVNPNTGAVTKVSQGLYLPSGAGWIGVVDKRDASPYRNEIDGTAQPNRIDWRDAGGRTTTWLYSPGHALDWIAFTSPNALLVMGRSIPADLRTQLFEFWLVTGPNRAVELARYSGQEQTPYQELGEGFFRPVADAHGIWIGSATSLYLMTPAGNLLRVLDRSAYPAGPCI